jgi:radical SAM protein with 4Fe4S-binding SPASM domain
MTTHNPHYSENRTMLADVIPLATPFTIQCEISQYCNLKCNYCIQSFVATKEKTMMNFGMFELLCNQIKEFGEPLKQFNFAGWGEPLINPRLPRMIKLVKDMGITNNVAVVTNGLLLDPAWAETLVNAGLDHLRISLQGMTSKRYFDVAKKNMSFDFLVQKIKYFYENKGQCQVSIKLADKELLPSEEILFYRTFEPISDRCYIEYIQPIFTGKQERYISKFGIVHPSVLICPQPFYMLAISATGDIIPCCSYYHPHDPMSAHNIKEDNLKEYWDGQSLYGLRKMLLNGKRRHQKLYPVCKLCNIPDVCILPEDDLSSKTIQIKRKLKVLQNEQSE